MTSKPETVLLQIKELENQSHTKSFLEFYSWLTDDEDSSIRNATNYLLSIIDQHKSYDKWDEQIIRFVFIQIL